MAVAAIPDSDSMLAGGHDAATSYRPDLDGLRAVAVVPVLLFHFRVPGFPGGFCGVDIFFVLSGFLITGLLLKDIGEKRFSLVDFYERRARRILPALLFMLLGTTVAAAAILLPPDLDQFGNAILATLAFGSNIYFWRASGYFEVASEFRLLLHTWSLSVEEQFYILFPLALWFMASSRRRWLVGSLLLVLGLSLALSAWGAYTRPSTAFYVAPFRAWELILGAVLAAAPIPRISKLANVASLVGIGLIAGSVALLTSESAFPGWLAIFPCGGAALVIWTSLSGGGLVNRALSWRPLVALGQVSYPLYLWHWPVAVLVHYMTGREPTGPQLIGMCAASLGVAFLSSRFVERPFRGATSRVSRTQLVAFLGTGTVALAVAALLISHNHGFPQRFTSDVVRLTARDPMIVSPDCFGPSNSTVRAGQECRLGAARAAAPSFAIWGDSHASRWAIALQQVTRASHVSGLDFTTPACPPLIGVDWHHRGCRDFNDAVLGQLGSQHVRVVFLSAIWAFYAEGAPLERSEPPLFVTDGASESHSLVDNRRVFSDSLLRTVEAIRATGAEVVIIGPSPEVGWDVPRGLARERAFGAKRREVSGADFRRRQVATLPAILRATRVPGVSAIWPDRRLCQSWCQLEIGGRPLYIDDNHLSAMGVSLFTSDVEAALDSALGPKWR